MTYEWMGLRKSWNNRDELKNDNICGCFNCLEIFNPKEIKRWTDKRETALCPYCGKDSVMGESSGFPVTKKYLKKVNKIYFEAED